jgi:multidrug transporter EmrE-like cation transporter
MNTPLASMAWVMSGSFIGSFGAVFLKAGAKRLDRNKPLSILSNWRLALGIMIYLISAIFFLFGVRKGELSVLYPLVAFGYVWTMFWSRLFFGEPLTKAKFFALGLILVGIAVLGLGNQHS